MLIRADGVERDVEGRLSLEGLQFIIGGGVQHMRLPDGRYMFLDEQGNRKPFNAKATALCLPQVDYIVGDVLVLTLDEFVRMSPNVRGFKKP